MTAELSVSQIRYNGFRHVTGGWLQAEPGVKEEFVECSGWQNTGETPLRAVDLERGKLERTRLCRLSCFLIGQKHC